MPLGIIHNVRFSGVSASVPRNTVCNRSSSLLSDDEKEKFLRTTGVEERRVAPEGVMASDLCLAAANGLIDELKWDRSEIGALVFVSQSMDYVLPATACSLQERLGLPKSCLAFDVGLGCSGYVYGLSILGSMISAMGIGKGLLLVGDLSSRIVSQRDKTTAPLFSDSGSATALELKKDVSSIYFNLCSDGSGSAAIRIPFGGFRSPITAEALLEKEISNGVYRAGCHSVMDGAEVFNFTMREVPLAIRELFAFSETSEEAVDIFFMHQANYFMNEQVRKKAKIPLEKHPYILKKFGNTSGGSIPLTMVDACNSNLKNKKQRLLLGGFGVGLSWGVALMETDKIVCPKLIEI